jgi:hypothetical protein
VTETRNWDKSLKGGHARRAGWEGMIFSEKKKTKKKRRKYLQSLMILLRKVLFMSA